ncbi:MAG: hypothetical protein GF320_08915 [Armatimonadia bacterium]|jgi:DNA-binding IclR family transcriptional regulator|nr:hypothetical protein [Armatimonadia bacterium]
MSRPLFSAWHSCNTALALRALLYLMEHPAQATTCPEIARRIKADHQQLQACLDELVDCGVATHSDSNGGPRFYRLSPEPSAHALAARVCSNSRQFENLSPALSPLLQRCTQRASGLRSNAR